MSINKNVVCRADGDRCHGCDHYYGRAPVCVFAPRAEQQGTPTPRTDNANTHRSRESGIVWVEQKFARQLERELSAAQEQIAALREALKSVERWEFPSTGKFWPSGNPMSFEVAYGSNGARDYMRNLASAALAATRQESSNG